ncbi:MAG: RDD family protein [Anaerolineales bacterium]|nr:RDD family protein [Anaerolineales bacterium]
MTQAPSNIAQQYVRKVMDLIYAPESDRERIRADLEAHLREGIAGGEDMKTLVERMGDPREVAAEFMKEVPLVYAGFGRRAAAFLVDMVFIIGFAALAAALTIVLANAVPQNPEGMPEKVLGGVLIVLVLIGANACIAMILAYFPLLEGRFGRTVGKYLLGLRVRSEDGLPPTYWQAFLRRLSFYFEIFPLEALFLALQPKRQRWFDLLAKTVVVRER